MMIGNISKKILAENSSYKLWETSVNNGFTTYSIEDKGDTTKSAFERMVYCSNNLKSTLRVFKNLSGTSIPTTFSMDIETEQKIIN